MKFPLYRKYSHNKTFFKVISEEEFEEIQIQGNGIKKYSFVARILPDRNYIQDLISNKNNNWVEIDEEQYERVKKDSRRGPSV